MSTKIKWWHDAIEILIEHSCLWDVKSIAYLDRNARLKYEQNWIFCRIFFSKNLSQKLEIQILLNEKNLKIIFCWNVFTFLKFYIFFSFWSKITLVYIFFTLEQIERQKTVVLLRICIKEIRYFGLKKEHSNLHSDIQKKV